MPGPPKRIIRETIRLDPWGLKQERAEFHRCLLQKTRAADRVTAAPDRKDPTIARIGDEREMTVDRGRTREAELPQAGAIGRAAAGPPASGTSPGAAMLRALSRHREHTTIASQQVWRITSHWCGRLQIAHGMLVWSKRRRRYRHSQEAEDAPRPPSKGILRASRL